MGDPLIAHLAPTEEVSRTPCLLSALSQMAGAVLVLDDGERIAYANASACSMLKAATPVGHTLSDVLGACE